MVKSYAGGSLALAKENDIPNAALIRTFRDRMFVSSAVLLTRFESWSFHQLSISPAFRSDSVQSMPLFRSLKGGAMNFRWRTQSWPSTYSSSGTLGKRSRKSSTVLVLRPRISSISVDLSELLTKPVGFEKLPVHMDRFLEVSASRKTILYCLWVGKKELSLSRIYVHKGIS